ncbi:sigma factor-like helix-turn-helix DNA-binding protein [Lentzea jiangxiensis]|uniref:RNA polymerase sigma-70 factor, ECF subfamily n=1 Tax=Lentzea jiangxiensis TaxID=641025 RepID=A0A1H0IU84_9PSEU|nr:sigma factor-like helix-turn-helix DNA-binding protein [Lentzea jiangxiensis]SDO34965.1 RNA polymerase sigma-70 factor, ECF subfamily [Lentzea jiangxiensis]
MTTRKARDDLPPGASLVADALSALEPEHRVVVVRAFYRGESVAELAEALELPQGAVKSRLHHGLHALRRTLLENGVMES